MPNGIFVYTTRVDNAYIGEQSQSVPFSELLKGEKMPVVSKTVLKSYFNDGDSPNESNYIDLIDTMGDMNKSTFDANSNNIVDNSEALGGVAAANYLQRVSANRPGVIKLYRRETDDGYTLQTYWASPYWIFQGYDPSNNYHAGVRVAYADLANNSNQLGGVAAASYLQRVSANRPGVTKLYRNDSDSAFNVQTYWDGTYWVLQGYNVDSYHGPCRVNYANNAGNADTVDGLHGYNLYSSNANFSSTGYLDTSSFVDAATGFRVNGQAIGGLVMYSTSTFKTNTSWDGDNHAIGAYTLTPAMFGYPSNAKALYVLLSGYGTGGYVGINDNSASYNYPLGISTPASPGDSNYGIVHLDGSGNMILRVGGAAAYITVQIWGYFI